ncbi:hypothetical protein BGX29_012358 [Mortierella sp. GBA35]|nr:hypothetical protein BGX29_012358 [Mortierella sp. GBA35]
MATFDPTIAPWLAASSCVGFTILFVGSLYVFPAESAKGKLARQAREHGNSTSAKPEVAIHPHSYSQYDEEQQARFQSPVENQKLDRNHPLVIKQRFKGIALTCFISFWARLGHFLGLLGISIPNNIFKLVNHVVLPLLLVGFLFMGPVLMMFLSNELPFQQAFDWASQRQHIQGLMGMRNFVVGPISEEFIFRACMVAIVSNSGAGSYLMIFVLPLVFGIAHINHAYESYVKKGRTRQAFFGAVAMAVFQLLYTTLFGWFATFLFLRTSNLIGPCLCHTFCNMMGFPDVTNIQYFGRWKKWLYLTFFLGMVLFGLLLRPLTNPAWYGDEDSSAYWRITMGAPAPQES